MTSNEPPGTDTARVIIWPPLLFGGAVALAWLLARLVPISIFQRFGIAGWQFWLGLVVLIIGVFLGLSGILAFRRAGTHVHPSHPSLVIVTDGPYRLTRNPMYLGAVLFLIGLAFSASLDWLLVLMPGVIAIVHYGIILREEAYLTGKFGETYQSYLARTHRWL